MVKLPGIGNLNMKAARRLALKKLKAAGIRKSVRVIRAEYMDFCEKQPRSEADKLGFLSVMKHVAGDDAKRWIKKERIMLIKKRIRESDETTETKKALLEELKKEEMN